MNRQRLTGSSPSRRRRRPFFLSGYVAFLAQDVVVAAQAAQLLALGGGQLAGPTTAGIDIDLVQPVAQGRPGDAEILGQLGDGFPAGAGQLDGLSAERCWVGRSGAWHVNSFESLLPSSVHVSGRSGHPRSWASASSRLSTNSTSLAIACPDAASRPTVLAQYCCSDAARVAQHPLDAAGSRWLQPASAAPGQQRFPQPLLAQLDRADLLGQPAGKLVLVADRLLPEAERSVDLRAVALDRPARPVVGAERARIDLDLPGDIVDRGFGQLAAAGEAAFEIEVLEDQGKAKARRAGLVAHQPPVVGDQRPAVDQLLRLPVPPHHTTSLPAPPSAPRGFCQTGTPDTSFPQNYSTSATG